MFQIGDGSSINIWEDSWIPILQGFVPLPTGDRPANLNRVVDLIDILVIICKDSDGVLIVAQSRMEAIGDALWEGGEAKASLLAVFRAKDLGAKYI
jgi:hypothetical protein